MATMRSGSNDSVVVYGYAHDVEKQYFRTCLIPDNIIDICYKFYEPAFLPLDNPESATPFSLLFAIYGMNYVASINTDEDNKAEVIKAQCNKLKDININGIDTLPIKSTMDYVLSKYHQHCVYLSTDEYIKQWCTEDLVVSLLHYSINELEQETENKLRYWHPKTWEFVEHLRKYWKEIKYNFDDVLEEDVRRYGLQTLKSICPRYNLRTGRFTKIKIILSKWAKDKRRQFHKGTYN